MWHTPSLKMSYSLTLIGLKLTWVYDLFVEFPDNKKIPRMGKIEYYWGKHWRNCQIPLINLWVNRKQLNTNFYCFVVWLRYWVLSRILGVSHFSVQVLVCMKIVNKQMGRSISTTPKQKQNKPDCIDTLFYC